MFKRKYERFFLLNEVHLELNYYLSNSVMYFGTGERGLQVSGAAKCEGNLICVMINLLLKQIYIECIEPKINQ